MTPLIRVSLFNADSEHDFTLLEDNGDYFVTEYVTIPPPVPPAPDKIVIQLFAFTA